MTILLGSLRLLLLLLYHLDALGLRWLSGQCDDRPAITIAEVEFLACKLTGGKELCDVGAGREGLACALRYVDLGDRDLVLALGGKVVEEPEVRCFGGGGGVLRLKAVAAAGEEGVGLRGLEIRVGVKASFVVVYFDRLWRGG